MEAPEFWLWPDRAITKLESRHLREEHNKAMQHRADLLAALELFLEVGEVMDRTNGPAAPRSARWHAETAARAAIAKAKGEPG